MNIQITKKDISKAFREANIPYDKIIKSNIGGYYVYTPYGMDGSYIKSTVIERGQNYVKKLKERIIVKRCFIDNQDLLEIAIMEAKRRMR